MHNPDLHAGPAPRTPDSRANARRWRLPVAALLLCLPLFAQASRKDDTNIALAQAQAAVQAAERAGAPEQAPLEMKAARDGLDLAMQQADEREWRDAQMYAERSEHDALLAEARARQKRAEALAAEIEAGISSLQAEINAGG